MTAPTFTEMREKLITLDQLRDQLAATESMRTRHFSVGDPVRFTADSSFNHGVSALAADEPVPAYVTLGMNQSPIQLTRGSFEEVSANIGLKRSYIADCPAELIIPQLNYWYREGLHAKRGKHDYQFLVDTDTSAAVAFGKQGMVPFSNLRLLDVAENEIRLRCGQSAEILVDYKLHHTLRQTVVRLVVPEACQAILPGDVWSLGLQVKNSLTGAIQTSMEGYLFRWLCTNGQLDKQASSGVFTRSKDSTEADAYEWARHAVDEVLGSMDSVFDAVKRLTEVGIDGRLSDTLRDIFEHYRIALPLRAKIIANLEEYDGEITMYVIMNAITQVANHAGLEPSAVESLMRVGGDFPYTAEQRCGACHRLMHSH